MYFEIASRGKQMVSKEGLKNWHQFWVSIWFLGDPILAPNSIEACFRTATEMAPIGPKMGLCGGPIFVTFCEPFGLILASAARTKRKKTNPSNARWLSPGRLSSQKDNSILQIHRINAVATSVMTTVCIQKRTE